MLHLVGVYCCFVLLVFFVVGYLFVLILVMMCRLFVAGVGLLKRRFRLLVRDFL